MEEKKTKSKRSKVISFVALGIVVLAAIVVLINPFHRQQDQDFIALVENKAISASISFVEETKSSTGTSYSLRISGVVFKKEDGRYYALTALHGIPTITESGQSEYIVLRYDQLLFAQWVAENTMMSATDYYSRFPRAVMEYSDEKYDLAVISFASEDDFATLPIAPNPPERGTSVAAMGNPWVERNAITTGQVTRYRRVRFQDELSEIPYDLMIHSAEISSGSSGSALLNKDLEIVGINLGGGINIFRQFREGYAMPCNKILDFLADMTR
jgi:S1-C subfamily serine protease